MEEMNKTLKNLTQQMSKLKNDPNVPAQPPPRNPMGYRRPYNPQFPQRERRNDDFPREWRNDDFQRERWNDDHTIQTPIRKDINNLQQDQEYEEDFSPLDEGETTGMEQ